MDLPENLPDQAVGVEQDVPPVPVEVDAAVLLLGAGVTAITHPMLYVKLLIQVAAVAKLAGTVIEGVLCCLSLYVCFHVELLLGSSGRFAGSYSYVSLPNMRPSSGVAFP